MIRALEMISDDPLTPILKKQAKKHTYRKNGLRAVKGKRYQSLKSRSNRRKKTR